MAVRGVAKSCVTRLFEMAVSKLLNMKPVMKVRSAMTSSLHLSVTLANADSASAAQTSLYNLSGQLCRFLRIRFFQGGEVLTIFKKQNSGMVLLMKRVASRK